MTKTADIATDLEKLICALSDIANARDLTDQAARQKAGRLYREMRLKYPIDARDAAQCTCWDLDGKQRQYDPNCPVHPLKSSSDPVKP
jgi:hypothetical protein